MRILVMSPLHNVGTTISSFIISEATSLILGRMTLLTHTDLNNNCIGSLVGKTKDDSQVQTSLSQLGCLIESNQVTSADIIAYTRKINNTLNFYSPIPIIKEEKEVIRLWEMFHKMTEEFKFTIIDSDSNNNCETTDYFKDMAELIFIVVNHDPRSHIKAIDLAKSFSEIKENIRTSSLKNRRIIFIVNGYEKSIEPIDRISKRLEQRQSNIITIPYDMNIPKYALKGNLQDYLLQSLKGLQNHELSQSIRKIAKEINPEWYRIADKAIRANRKAGRK